MIMYIFAKNKKLKKKMGEPTPGFDAYGMGLCSIYITHMIIPVILSPNTVVSVSFYAGIKGGGVQLSRLPPPKEENLSLIFLRWGGGGCFVF